MGICFLFFIFGLTVSAEEDLQRYQSLQTGSIPFKMTMPSEEQNSSSHNHGKGSIESTTLHTVSVISPPGTDLIHTTHERQHSSTVNATTTIAITSNGASFVSAYGTGSLFLSEDSNTVKQFKFKGDLHLISYDEGNVHPSAKAEFEPMINDTMTPAAHVSRGRENISALLHASLKSKNQTVLDSITLSPTNGIPIVSASDQPVTDDLGESNESVTRQGENKNENWTQEYFATDNPLNRTEPIQVDEISLNKNHTTIMHLAVLRDKGLLTTVSSASELGIVGQNPRNGFVHESKMQKNLPSPSSVILETPLQGKSTSQIGLNKMTESSRNLSTNGPKPILGVSQNGIDEKRPDSIFLFVASKLAPTKIQETTTLNNFPSNVTAAGEIHLTKLFVTSRLTSDSLHRIVSTSNEQESKLIFHTKSSKEHQIKPILPFQTSTTSSLHHLNKSDAHSNNDLFLAFQNSSSSQSHFLQMPDLCTKGSINARTLNMSVIEKRNRIDNFPILLSKLLAFRTPPFTYAEEASTASAKIHFIKLTQSSFTAPPTLSPQAGTLTHPDQFEKLSTTSYLPPLTKLHNVFNVSQTNFGSKKLKPFVSNPTEPTTAQTTRKSSELELIQSSFTSATVKRLKNMQDFTEVYSKDQNKEHTVSQKGKSLISERPNKNISINSTIPSTSNKRTSPFHVPIILPTHQTTNSNVSETASFTSAMAIKVLIIKPSPFEPQVSVANKVSQNKTSPPSTPFSKSLNIVTTDATVLLKLLAISKKSSSESIFLNHSMTGKIGLPLGDKKQVLKNQNGTKGLFVGSHTVSSVPSVQEYIEPQPGEPFLTATLQSQSRAQIESYLKKRNDTVKLTTLKHSDNSIGSVVSMNQTSLKSILPKIVTLSQNILPIHSTSVSPVVYSTSGFNQHLTFSAWLETSTFVEQAMTQTSATHFTVQPITSTESGGKDNHKDSLLSHQGFANSTDVKEYAQNMASSQISGIAELHNRHTMHTTASAQTEATLDTSAFPFSPLESSTAATSPTPPLFLFRMQTVLHKDPLTLPKSQTEFFNTRKEQSKMAQPNFLSDKMSSSGTTEDIQKHLGQNALSAVTGKKLSRSVYTDLIPTSTETESVPQGSLQSRGGSEDVSDNATSFAENDSTEFLSDLPLLKRKRRITSPDSLSGLAQISDDICGTGNYTAEMSLNLERDIMPGDLIPALGNLLVVISLKTNNSQVNLKIKSCCLSPTVRLDEFNTTCCIFSRPTIDPHGIRLLSSVLSKRASFTISLFQMINYSTAYLHCDLSVCLRNHSECKKQSVQHRNTHPVEEAGAILGSTGNRISFGPLLKRMDNSSFSETEADMEAAVVIISSVASCLLVCLALMLVWMANRRCLEKSAYCWSRALCDC